MTPDKLEATLQSIGLRNFRHRGRNLMFSCPFHGADNSPSCGIAFEEPHLWGCFACSEKGNLVTLLIKAGGWEYEEASKLDRLNKDTKQSREAFDLGKPIFRHEENEGDLIDRTDLYPYSLKKKARRYLRSRGVLLSVAKKAGVCYAHDLDRVVFPWMQRDNLVGVTGRTLDKKIEQLGGKTIPLFGSRKGHTLYVPSSRIRRGRLILVEGEIDALKVWSAGFRNVAAIAHGILTKAQINEIARSPASELLCFFDYDKAGRRLVQQVMDEFKGKKAIAKVLYKKFSPKFRKKIDPAQLSRGTLRYVLSDCVEAHCDWIDF